MPRMHILTASEQKAFDAPPVLSYAERDTFFQVSERLDAMLATLRSPTNRVGLVLTIGYFRATKRFSLNLSEFVVASQCVQKRKAEAKGAGKKPPRPWQRSREHCTT
jgi:hypothetical protein